MAPYIEGHPRLQIGTLPSDIRTQCLWGRDHAIGHAWHRHLVIPLSLRAWLTVLGTLTNAGRSGFAEVPLPQPVSCVMLLFLIHIPLGPMHSLHVP